MDPLALAAVVGLVFAGKRFAESEDAAQPASTPESRPVRHITRREVDLMAHPAEHSADYFDLKVMTPNLGRRIGDWRLQPKNEIPSLQTPERTNTRFPYGQPVYDLYARENVTNKMNNLQPIERMNVGPGLGLGPEVPAGGGFHDYFRALPNNINEERLTTLKGLPGPSNPVVKNGGAGGLGEITHEAKDTKAWYRPPAQNRGEGQGGALTGPEGRPKFLKNERSTIRQQTGAREDTLSMGPGQYKVTQPYAVGTTAYTDKSLTRASGLRSNPDRPGNAGRMNVRQDPVNQGGAMSRLRSETVPFPVPHMNAGRFQQYKNAEFYKFDEKKANPNPLSDPSNLDVAILQLEKNPVALPPLAVV
jgi:Family of unknown function (DUF5899)